MRRQRTPRRARRPPTWPAAGPRPARFPFPDIRRRADEGAVTAEFAVVLPSVVAIAALILALSRAVIVSMDCQDAAAAAARELVVSGDAADPAAVARAVAGDGASARVTRSGATITVVVQCPVLPGPLGIVPAKVSGEATGVTQ